MAGPLDAIRAFHNAFRRDMLQIDDAAYKIARDGGDILPVIDRLRGLEEWLLVHEAGEEKAVFPAVDDVAPLVAKAYFIDHRELDTMVETLEDVENAPDSLTAARGTAAITAHLRIHLDKEDVHLYPILRERTTLDDQASIVGIMAAEVPPERAPNLVGWLFPLLSLDDRVVMLNVWKSVSPPPVFSGLKSLVEGAVSEAEWAQLTERIPELS